MKPYVFLQTLCSKMDEPSSLCVILTAYIILYIELKIRIAGDYFIPFLSNQLPHPTTFILQRREIKENYSNQRNPGVISFHCIEHIIGSLAIYTHMNASENTNLGTFSSQRNKWLRVSWKT